MTWSNNALPFGARSGGQINGPCFASRDLLSPAQFANRNRRCHTGSVIENLVSTESSKLFLRLLILRIVRWISIDNLERADAVSLKDGFSSG